MKINIAKTSGLCFGVRRAIEMCLDLAGKDTPVFVLGDIVHNDHVVRKLAAMGVKKIGRIDRRGRGILVISAHGSPRSVFKKAERSGFEVVDATCPRVKDIYGITRSLEKDNTVVIIGDKGHAEVKGIAGQLKKRPILIEFPTEVIGEKLRDIKRCAVVSQSTQSPENIKGIMRRIRRLIPSAKFYNTLCSVTMAKQKEVKSLSRKNDVVLIVGSRTSANTKRLYQAARKINEKTYRVDSEKNLKKSLFRNARSVGIMAGASTPDEVVWKIIAKLKNR